MDGAARARLPSIRELELSCSAPAPFSEPANLSPHMFSPIYPQFPSPPTLTPSSSTGSRHMGGDQQNGRPYGQGTSTGDGYDDPADRSPGVLVQEMAPAFPRNDNMIGHRFGEAPMHPYQPQAAEAGHAPHFAHQPPPMPAKPVGAMRLDFTTDKQPFLTTPPRSPERTPLAGPSQATAGLNAHGEISSSSTDDAIAETRRQRRESKERRRRRDQRSLTVCIEQSVPSWVFSRLKTRHSASKVNGGGRATNAVISGACIWLRVLDRAMQENVPHWTIAQVKGMHGGPAMDRWLQFVDEEAAILENWDLGDDDSGSGGPGSMDMS